MLVNCSYCQVEMIATRKSGNRQPYCNKCQRRGMVQENIKLGLHPALEKKWSTKIASDKYLTNVWSDPSLSKAASSSRMPPLANEGRKSQHPYMTQFSEASITPKIPGFELSYQVGRGAMGSVYKARQISTGRLVALKILSKDLSLRSDLVARFEREAFALKSLKHDNVVSIIDAGQVDETHYFVMEFIDGITLRTRINRGPISVEEASFITEQILYGLGAAHKLGIIHRDLKPENVLLSYNSADFSKHPSRVVLVDFGLVGIGGFGFDPHPNLTRSKVTMGTVNYMAPEQHIDAKRVDQRTDLYSAGVMLFEMITGDLPLGRYVLPFERGMNVAKEIDDILARSLARSLDDRYASTDRFLADLHSFKEQAEKKKQLSMPEVVDTTLAEGSKNLIQGFKKYRYIFLFLAAAMFFGFGIKLSIAGKNEASLESRVVKP